MISTNKVTDLDLIIEQEAASYKGPVLLYDMNKIEANMRMLARAMQNPRRVQMAIKSFPHPSVIQLADRCGLSFEISNQNEYKLLPKHIGRRTVALNNPLGGKCSGFTTKGNRLHVNIEKLTDLEQRRGNVDCKYALRLNHKDFPIERRLLADPDKLGRFGIG